MHRQLEDAFSNAVFFYIDAGDHPTNWSRTVCAGLREQNFDEVPFRVPQLLEPSALFEVAHRHAVGIEQLEFFTYEIGGAVAKLKWLADMLDWAPPVQKLNLAQCLAATCRYRFAKKILERIPYSALCPDQRVAYHLTRFAVYNRLELSATFQQEFSSLRYLVETCPIRAARVLDICSQAIVWKIKGDVIDGALNKWFMRAGDQASKKISSSTNHDDLVSLSSYYRALAMVPAAANDVDATRKYMLLAEHFAEEALCSDVKASITGQEVRKMVYESKLKEMLYVARDIQGARRVAEELIACDTNWSISYHEAGEVEMAAHEWERALGFYQSAYDVGFPRLTYSQYMIGACHQKLNNFELAVESFRKTLLLDPSNLSACIAGRDVAAQHLPEVLPFFTSHVDKLASGNTLAKVIQGE